MRFTALTASYELLGYYAQLTGLAHVIGLRQHSHHALAAGTGTYGYELFMNKKTMNLNDTLNFAWGVFIGLIFAKHKVIENITGCYANIGTWQGFLLWSMNYMFGVFLWNFLFAIFAKTFREVIRCARHRMR